MSEIQCQVINISPLTSNVYKVELAPASGMKFKAGQYVLVHMGEDDKRPFSIASAPVNSGKIELHIGADENNAYASEVLAKMRDEKRISLSGGHGDAHLQPDGKPIVLIAGGTGFSYTYSILQQLLHDSPDADVTLYWGGREKADLYLFDELTELSKAHPNFTFVPVVEFPQGKWEGKTGWVHKAVMDDYEDMSSLQVYIAGRFEMAKVARDDFTQRGLAKERLFGDAYAFI